ncbi:MAG: CRTAC1 family protein [Verrucomicrobiales bacterium]|nr:CRTAC1 family protein [Verrucomicrobiales bacterium]
MPFTPVAEESIGQFSLSVYSGAWGDANGDGRPDLFLPSLFNQLNPLFYNQTNGFVRESALPLGNLNASGAGAVWIDVDNDGDLDLFLATTLGEPKYLYHNDGTGGFTFVQDSAGQRFGSNSQTCAAADFDNDGLVDVFLPNGGGFGAERNFLFRNVGGDFVQVTEGEVVTEFLPSHGGAFADFNGDGFVDLFVANIGAPNSLFRNDGRGGFIKVTSGAVVEEGTALGATSAAWGDYDNDGDLDLFVSHGQPFNFLYRNEGGRQFVKVTDTDVARDGGNCIGSLWADLDLDGWLDLIVARRGAPPLVYRGTGDGQFEREASSPIVRGGNGVAAADYDLDGDVDILVANWEGDGPTALYRNDVTGRQWLGIRLEGRFSNRFGVGARVRVRANIGGRSLWQLRQIGGEDALGSQELIARFGLADAAGADEVIIEWPSGLVQNLGPVRGGQVLRVVESEFQSLSPVRLNLQTGLYEHRVRYTRLGGNAENNGVRIQASGLPTGVRWLNATGVSDTSDAEPYIQLPEPLARGQSIELVFVFQKPGRGGLDAPEYSAEYGSWEPGVPPGGSRLEVTRTVTLPEAGRVLVEFVSQPGARYAMEYSADLEHWHLVPGQIVAGGTRTQWIDAGPPSTATAPSAEIQRFYRVVKLETTAN